ncbi:4a-hydroxytetrahydrobiopterin dehydratase [Streptomyces sp. NPDC051776]|uniref:4a-hydroxytetrahydrobiopterin dehydratase n=1 Tax=Streptomyces sp. NPDC051776 TaxID=3155414 RepID=UPI0034416A2F
MHTTPPTPGYPGVGAHDVCQGAAAAMEIGEVGRCLEAIPGWVSSGTRLHKTFHCTTFRTSIEFVLTVAEISENANHHPNLHVEDKRSVKVELWTRRFDALTRIDFELAAVIDAAYEDLEIRVENSEG